MTNIALSVLLLVSALQAPRNFINIDGPDLKARVSSAISRGAAQRGSFWLAYTFSVRPGVLFDMVYIGPGGSRMVIDGKAFVPQLDSRNLAVFLLYEGAGRTAVRAEIYNLDRARDYSGYPVYWLGSATAVESLPFLRGLLDTMRSIESSIRLVDTMGAHDDPRTAMTLRDIVRDAKIERARTTAVSWLGHAGGQTDFLAGLVRDEREATSVRREAAEALGDSETPSKLLQDLYRAVSHHGVKEQLLESMGEKYDSSAVSFLIETFQRESDRNLREEVIDSLSDMEDDRAVDALAKAYDSSKDDQLKKEILDALGDAESPRAMEKLFAVAKGDPSVRLRRRAVELLGESHSPDALEFLEGLLK